MDLYVVIVRSGKLVQAHVCSTEDKAWETACAVALNLIRHGYFVSGAEGQVARMEIDAAVKASDWKRAVNLYVSFTAPNYYIGVQQCPLDSAI